MTETTCARCETRAESQWRIRLEAESEETSEETPYRLCRGCWNELQARFSESDTNQ